MCMAHYANTLSSKLYDIRILNVKTFWGEYINFVLYFFYRFYNFLRFEDNKIDSSQIHHTLDTMITINYVHILFPILEKNLTRT